MNTLIQSQFNYCPLVWMFHSRTINNKINKLHERLVYINDNLTFPKLLQLDDSGTIHQRNLQKLAIEMHKAKNHISPLQIQKLHNLRRNNRY